LVRPGARLLGVCRPTVCDRLGPISAALKAQLPIAFHSVVIARSATAQVLRGAVVVVVLFAACLTHEQLLNIYSNSSGHRIDIFYYHININKLVWDAVCGWSIENLMPHRIARC